MNGLAGKTALVIGGSGGIGLALAAGLARAGAGVTIAARTESRITRAIEMLRSDDPDALGFATDVTDNEQLEGLVSEITERRGLPDILVNCQGTTVIGPTVDITAEDYDRVMGTNLRSVFFACLAFGLPMIARGSGSIVNIASLAAHRGWPNAAVYAMSKHGVLGLTRSLAAEWARQGVRVNSISPGFFMTDLNRERMPQARKDAALFRTPAGRFGEVDELVGAVRYLASDDAGFVTGTDISVDGGYLAGGI
jgi:NAD(P)-dependent dehydrogenase (short-subunit alcohol dehydrogenase family)